VETKPREAAADGGPTSEISPLAQPALQLSVVAASYNEEESLEELYRRTSAACCAAAGTNYEIVLVDDGSSDQTWMRMVLLANRDQHIVAVNLSRNYGHQLALSAGLSLCRGERVLVLDADLQDPPELLAAMMARMDEGADVVYGQRVSRLGETAFKRVTASAFYRLFRRMVDIEIPLDAGDFRLMSRRTVDMLNRMPEYHRFIRGMVGWIGFRQEPIPYERAARFAGKTKYPLSKMVRFALDAITAFSIKPLRLASWLGLGSGLAGLLVVLYVLTSWIGGHAVRGWTSVMIVILMLGSSQLLVMGLIGEYLGRLYLESKNRPLFIVKEIVRGAPASAGTLATRPIAHSDSLSTAYSTTETLDA
jgi:dolichol-phosphate mannosyltransferase